MPVPSTSNFPASLDDAASLGGDAVNLTSVILSGALNNSATTIPTTATLTNVNVPCWILIDSELVWAETKSGADFTGCNRGAGGTSAASHSDGASIKVVYAANHFNQLKRAVIAIETELGADPAGTETNVVTRLNSLDTRINRVHQADGDLDFPTSTELTIATGSITPTQNWHTVDTEADAASDDLDTIAITNVTDGFILVLRANADARSVVIKHNTGNILCATATDITLDDQRDIAILIYDATLTKWLAGTFSVSSSGGVTSGPQSFGDNYVITPSVASNNLTVALKTVAGADPSAGDPITIRIGDTKQTISAAISTTKNAGTNWCNSGGAELATLAVDYFVYLIQETGASAGTKIGFSRISTAQTMADFVNTTTDEKYIAGSWTNFNATDKVENIGRFRATLSAGAGYTWSIATSVVINRPIYSTDWLTWTPVETGFSAVPTGGAKKYKYDKGTLQVNYSPPNPGTSNATTYTVTIPFKGKNVAGYNQWFPLGFTYDNSTGVATGQAQAQPNSNIVILSKSAGGAWTGSGTKLGNFTLFVEIE